MAKSTSTKASFKQSIEDSDSIMSSLKKKSYKGIYLLMGDEPYFIDKIADFAAKNILGEQEREFNQTVLYGKETTVENLIELCRSYPMMSAYNVVILKEAQAMKGFETFANYLISPQPSTLLFICYKEGNMDKRSSLYKKIKEFGVIFESVSPRDYEIGAWIKGYYKSRGFQLEEKALVMLTEHLGASMTKVIGESEKLFVGVGMGVTQITDAHIEQHIGISKEYNIFELNKAFSERNIERALTITAHFGQNPKEFPLVVSLGMIFTHFLRIFSLGIILWNSSKKRMPPPSDLEIAKELKLPNPFFVKEYTLAVRNWPTAKSFQALSLIREYDMKSKGVGNSSATDAQLLAELLFKLFAL